MEDYKDLKEIVSLKLYEILLDGFMSGFEMRVFLLINEDLREHLPETFKDASIVPFDIDGQSFDDSFIEDDIFILVTELNGQMIEIEITPETLQGIRIEDSLNLLKPFVDNPKEEKEVSIKSQSVKEVEKTLDPVGLKRSMDMFRKNNPHMFKN